MNTQNSKLTKLKASLSHKGLPIAVVAATLLMSASSTGAVTVTSLSLNAEVDNTDTAANDITYRSKSRSIAGFTDSTGQQWALGSGSQPTAILRRSGVGNANRQVVWTRREPANTTTPYIVNPSQPTTTQAVLDQNNIYYGTDNLFTNTGNTSGNQSDVERLDIIFAQPVTVTSDRAIAIFERGATNGHDGFKIAAITAVDPVDANLPLTYGNLVTQSPNTWGTTGLTGGNQNYVVLNNTGTGGAFTGTAAVSQEIGGEVIPLTSLATTGTTIRGYSLFGSDVTNQVLTAWNTFPTTTAESNGGIDLMAADLGVVRKVPFGFSPSLGLLLVGGIWGFPSVWRHYRQKLAQS